MRELGINLANQEIMDLDLTDLDLADLDIQGIEQKQGLESLTTGHGMIETGASIFPVGCCSCCLWLI